MKDIKTFIIGFLTCICMFLIMGQSTSDGDGKFETIHAKQIYVGDINKPENFVQINPHSIQVIGMKQGSAQPKIQTSILSNGILSVKEKMRWAIANGESPTLEMTNELGNTTHLMQQDLEGNGAIVLYGKDGTQGWVKTAIK